MAIDRSKVSKQAESYVASGKFDRALEEFQKLLEDRPDDSATLNRVGDVCLQANRTADAVEMFRKAAQGFERDGFNNKATAVLKKAHRAAPEDVDVASRLADLYRQTNMIKDAIAIHVGVAELFTKKGLIKRALEEFAQVVELDPKNLKNKVKLADLYNKEGMKDRAAGIYLEVAEALALDQLHVEASQVLERARAMISTPQVFLTQSRLCIIQKDMEGALRVLREGLTANPRSPEIYEALAEVELQAKHPDKALEVLGQVPQMAEKALVLCERALRELARSGRVVEALDYFKPIGREFARRGSGEVAAAALKNGLQGFYTAEAWIQLAEIFHQSGAKQERIAALRKAYVLAREHGEFELAQQLGEQLTPLGVSQESLTGQIPDTTNSGVQAITETTDVDPVRRMQIEQLLREADNFIRNRFMDRAQDAYQRILELDPANRDAINRIADIIKASGKMTGVQMHYVKVAEKLVPLGFRDLALECLDRAEALFPGSTRLYRRNLGLLEAPTVTPAQHTMPSAPASQAIALPAGRPMEVPPAAEIPLESLPLIPLDLPGAPEPYVFTPAAAPAPVTPPSFDAPSWESALLVPGLPTEPEPEPVPFDSPILRPDPFGGGAPGVPPLPTAPEDSQIPSFDDAGFLEPLPSFPEEAFASPAPFADGGLDVPQAPLEVSRFLPPAPPLEDDFFMPPTEATWSQPPVSEPPAVPAPPAFAPDLPGVAGEVPAPLEPELAPEPGEITWADLTSEPAPADVISLGGLEPLELEPLPFVPAAKGPVAEGPVWATPVEELANLLPDIDFQLDYGSPEEARIAILDALATWPEHPDLTSRLEAADAALRKLGHAAAEAAPVVESDFTGSFFDLTDVLGDAFLETGEGEEMHDATNVVEKIQSVEELFDAFREGVEQQVRGDDYDTHYNLGIAYKEMMLIEPAMEEFRKAMRDPERTLECCSMLSICESSQGNLEAAVTWLHKGIRAPGFPPEDAIGLRYDLGEILTTLGRLDEARVEYEAVAELDSEYREVAQRLGR